jgi:ATP-dependent DNA helicase RecQ
LASTSDGYLARPPEQAPQPVDAAQRFGLPEPAETPEIELDRALLDELTAEHPTALGTPRQRARFLCGLSSPATTKAKLSRHALFGSLAEQRFADVLALS